MKKNLREQNSEQTAPPILVVVVARRTSKRLLGTPRRTAPRRSTARAGGRHVPEAVDPVVDHELALRQPLCATPLASSSLDRAGASRAPPSRRARGWLLAPARRVRWVGLRGQVGEAEAPVAGQQERGGLAHWVAQSAGRAAALLQRCSHGLSVHQKGAPVAMPRRASSQPAQSQHDARGLQAARVIRLPRSDWSSSDSTTRRAASSSTGCGSSPPQRSSKSTASQRRSGYFSGPSRGRRPARKRQRRRRPARLPPGTPAQPAPSQRAS